MIGFKRYDKGPIARAGYRTNGWFRDHVANPAPIEFNGQIFMYLRGIAGGAPSTVGVWTAQKAGFDGANWNQNPVTNPVINAGASGAADASGIFDPCAVVFNGKVYLYYDGQTNGSTIMLATSTDGLNFTKVGTVGIAGGTPCAVVDSANVMHVFYTKGNSTDGWAYFKRTSTDGITFGAEQAVFSASGVAGTFDQKSVITTRIVKEGAFYYMVYGGSPVYDDYPEGFGIARSSDLVNWVRSPANPVLLRGPAGTWDESALWSGAPINVNGVLYMFYEGVGTNDGAGGSSNSNNTRDVKYGGYNTNAFSQVGLSFASSSQILSDFFDVQQIPDGNYIIVNQATGGFLSPSGSATALSTVKQRFYESSEPTIWAVNKKTTGFYSIKSGSLLLSILSNDRSNGGQAVIDTDKSSQSQEWYLKESTRQNDGSIACDIVNRYSGKSLQLSIHSKATGIPVVQFNPFGNPVHRWIMIPVT